MTKEQLVELKQELKNLAASLKEKKPASRKMESNLAKDTADGVSYDDLYKIRHELWSAKYNYRHKHIVCCLIRGRTRDEIERPKESNMPDENFIANLLKRYEMPVKQKDSRNHIDWERSDFVPKRARKTLSKEELAV